MCVLYCWLCADDLRAKIRNEPHSLYRRFRIHKNSIQNFWKQHRAKQWIHTLTHPYMHGTHTAGTHSDIGRCNRLSNMYAFMNFVFQWLNGGNPYVRLWCACENVQCIAALTMDNESHFNFSSSLKMIFTCTGWIPNTRTKLDFPFWSNAENGLSLCFFSSNVWLISSIIQCVVNEFLALICANGAAKSQEKRNDMFSWWKRQPVMGDLDEILHLNFHIHGKCAHFSGTIFN